MNQPLISVVIPAYNVEKRLDRCLESVCGQNWTNLEIIVVNDGSRDGTGARLDEWAAKDDRIQAIHQENAGVSQARNRGMSLCRGEWIRFVDADDLLPQGSLEKQYSRAVREESDLVLGGYEHKFGDVDRVCNLAKRDDTVSCDEYLLFLKKHGHTFFCGALWNKLFRRELIERGNVRFRDGLTFGEDFYFVCEYLKEAERVSFSTDVVYRYIRHPDSMTFTQAMDAVIHPIRNGKVKLSLYRAMRDLFIARGQYERHGHGLWLYLFRYTLYQ